MKKTLFMLYILLIWCFETMAQNTHKLTVDELFEQGVQNSVAIQASTVQLRISDDRANLVKNRQLPDISVSGLFGYAGTPVIMDKDLSFINHSDVPDWKQNYQIVAIQPIYQGGRIKNNIEKARLEKEITELLLQKNKADLKLWLIGKYLALFNLYKERDVFAKNIEEAKIRLHDIEKMKEQCMITTNDVLRSKLALTNYELFLKETENNIALTSQQLDIALGLDENTLLEPDRDMLASRFSLLAENDYVSQAYRQYPDMKIAESRIALARNNLKQTKADYLPALSLQAGNTLVRPLPNVSPAQDLFLNAWGVNLNLTWHISSLFDTKYSTNAAKQEIYLQQLAEEQQKQQIRTEIKTAFIKHREAGDRVKVLQESLVQANENYRIVKNKYFNQLAILTDLLDANTVQLNAELQLTAAQTNSIYTYYQLQNVSGNL